MKLFSAALAKHKLTFVKLSQCMEYLPMVSEWVENEWGYIRGLGIDERMNIMRDMKEDVYIGFYAGQPLAMFGLEKKKDLPQTMELKLVYVDANYRGLGFAKQIIETAKELAARAGATTIILDTLKPTLLNPFYEKFGAIVVAEGRLFSQPTEVLTMSI